MIVAIVIVIYNRYIEEYYKMYKNILNYKYNNIYFFDNSDIFDIQKENSNYCQNINLFYHSMSGNKGLSTAYNNAIDNIEESDYVLFLDDDTKITREFFDCLYLNLESGKDVYIPYIVGQDKKIYSPNKAGYFKNKPVKFGQIPECKINGIMSCTTIKYPLIKKIRFDERLFLDQVDQLLFDKLRLQNASIEILKITVRQNFHQREKINSKKAWTRLRIRLRDLDIYYQISNYNFLFRSIGKIKGIILGLQLTINSKSLLPVLNAIKYEFSLKNKE